MKRIHTVNTIREVSAVSTQEPRQWWIPAVVVGTFGLFLLAVFSAGVSIRASYTLAHLQERREIALNQQQVLQEQLAEVTSLAYTQQYAETSGFETSAIPVATLNLTTPVAQR